MQPPTGAIPCASHNQTKTIMAVKTTGAEFKRFYTDPAFWPPEAASHKDNVWHEDELISVDGEQREEGFDFDTIPDSAQVTVEGGVVFGLKDEPSFETYFKRWRKLQSTSVLVVECDVTKLDAVKSAVRAAGGRVL